jgi:NAD(P)-dependent dehydrogenase (short-subunit alcohol dehydrogenase family)
MPVRGEGKIALVTRGGERHRQGYRGAVRMSVLGRMATPGELASAFLFRASSEASFISSRGLAVDGGALLKM